MHPILTLCSNPQKIAVDCREERDLPRLVRVALGAVLGATAVFGLVVGGQHSGGQAVATAVKLPLVWLVTLVFSAPALFALGALMRQPIRPRALLGLLVAAAGRASMVLFAFTPVIWLYVDALGDSALGYHRVTMLAAAIYGAGGLAALGILVRAFPKRPTRIPIVATFSLAFLLVAGQAAWSLRPFVGRPSEPETPWLRAPEDTFIGALTTGWHSAQGRYRRQAPRPWESR